MDSQMKNRMKRRETKKCNRFRARDKPDRIDLFKKAKASFDVSGKPPPRPILQKTPTFSTEEISAKIAEIDGWIEELKKVEVNKNTDLEKEETVLFLDTMLKELMQAPASDETIRIVEHRINEAISQKRKEVANLKKEVRRKQKQLNRQLDLKHYDGSLANKMFELIRERNVENVELVKTALDRLWRKTMNGEIQTGKDFEAISAAQDFLREVQSKTS